ncbi:MAG: MFS transporter [Alphaproteobacteria bacterium]|jgi:MFS family permease|nr:MFS transporter [Alphaproteobacteria bacterium]
MSDAVGAGARRRILTAIVVCMAVYGITLGMTAPLLSLILEARGTERTLIGLNAAMPALAMLLVSPLIPRLVGGIGFRPFLFGCLAIELATFLALPVFDHLYAWFAIRFVMGASGGGLFIVAETWINQIADDKNRGRIMGLYVTVLAGGFAAGPLILVVTGTAGWTPFLVGAGFIAAAMLPLTRTGADAPVLEGRASFSILRFIAIAPTLAGAVLVFAFVETTLFALMPVFAVRSGAAEATAAIMLAVLTVGNVAAQLPIGWAADRWDRYGVMIACAAAGLAGALLLPLLIGTGAALWLMLLVWGGLLPGIYTVAMAILGQRFRGDDLITANAAFGVLWGVGSLAGPALGGAAMDLWDPHGLPATLAVASALFLVVALVRHAGRGRRGY